MRGLSFHELAQCASRHPVVVLIATEEECHALILQPNEEAPVTLKLSRIAPHELKTISIVDSAQMRGSESAAGDGHRMAMKMSSSDKYHPALAKLWTAIVQPIIHRLRLQVSTLARRFNSCVSISQIHIE
jgi:hypothetical protein